MPKYNEQSVHHVFHLGDYYDVRLHGCTIVSITRYINGSNRREELDYSDCSEELQDKLLDIVHKILLKS